MKLKKQYEKATLNKILLPIIGDDPSVLSNIHETVDELHEYLGMEEELYEEDLKLSGNLSNRQIRKLFRAASSISKGEIPSFDNKSEAMDLLSELNRKIKMKAKETDETPVDNFEGRIKSLMHIWKDIPSDGNAILKMTQKIGEYGSRHPEKTKFLISSLAVLISIQQSPHFKTVAPAAIKGILKIAQGYGV